MIAYSVLGPCYLIGISTRSLNNTPTGSSSPKQTSLKCFSPIPCLIVNEPLRLSLSFPPLSLSLSSCLIHSQSHRRQHNKDKPYKCHSCNRGYTDAASLEVHLSTHTVKHAKLYSCGLCNRTYTSVRMHSPSCFEQMTVLLFLYVISVAKAVPRRSGPAGAISRYKMCVLN